MFFDAVFASAISACFIPVFSEYLTRKGREPAFRFAGCFITVMGLLSAVLSVLGILFAVFAAIASFGIGNPDSRDHAGDENVNLADYYTHIEMIEELIKSYDKTDY